MNETPLKLGTFEFSSRLLAGTGKFSDMDTMTAAVEASGAQLVTVALRRFNRERPDDDLYGPLARLSGVTLMPNTSGARNAEEAVRIARLARELCGSPFIKLEIHPNPHHLMPDPLETFAAAKILVKEGFLVMPYMAPDAALAKRLEDVGCASVMPLGSAIGSGHGLRSRDLLGLIVSESGIPVIVDAGIRAPSDAAAAMEMGCSAVLVNSAMAAAEQPVAMARAFAAAVRAGRQAALAGLMPVTDRASPTSPLTAFLTAASEPSDSAPS
jgi:thiazole synthase